MNGNEFLDKFSLVNPEFIEEAENAKRLTKSQIYRVILPFAACLAFVIFFFPSVPSDPFPGELPGEDIGNVPIEGEFPSTEPSNFSENLFEERAKEVYNPDIQFGGNPNTGTVWPWELLTESERYSGLIFNGVNYHSNSNRMESVFLGEYFGSFEVLGLDEMTEELHSKSADVYSILKIDPSVAVAVQFDMEYFVFSPDDYALPENLGEFIKTYNLTEYLPLDRFSEFKANWYQNRYGLKDYGYIWEILESCGDAKLITDEKFKQTERNYLSFTANSDALGIYNMAFYVTEDGYIWTNICRRGYIFEIGEEAAGKIIAYALENKTEPPLPITEAFFGTISTEIQTLYGTVTEVTEDHFFVSDEIMCKDPADAMVFKVSKEDIRISRNFTEYGGLGVGSTVRVNFITGVDLAKDNLIVNVLAVDWIQIGVGILDGEEETNPA